MKLKKKKIESLIEDTKNHSYFIAKQFIKDDATIEDVLQESYTKAFKNINQLDDLSNFGKWFNRIVVNTCKDTLKKKKELVFSDISIFDEQIDVEDKINLSPENAMNYKDTSNIIESILNDIPVDQRVSLFLFYYEDWSIKEIAEHLGVKEATIKSRLFSGRKEVGKRVDDYQNKHNIKLYNIAIIPLITYAWYQLDHSSKIPVGIALSTVGMGIEQATGIALSINKIIIGIVAATVIGVGGFVVHTMNQDEELVLNKDTHIIEYGETISNEPSVYIKNTDKDLLKETKVNISDNEDEFASLGKHKITITYRSQSLICYVEVKDTIAPTMTAVNNFEVEYGTTIDDFISYTTIEDLSEVTTTVDKGGYDSNVAGTYTIKIEAVDSSDNKSEISFKVTVKDKPAEEEIVQETTQTTQPVETPDSSNTTTTNNTDQGCGSSCGTPTPEYCYGPGRTGQFYPTYAEAEAAGRDYIQSHPEEFEYNTPIFFSIQQCKAGYYPDFGTKLD